MEYASRPCPLQSPLSISLISRRTAFLSLLKNHSPEICNTQFPHSWLYSFPHNPFLLPVHEMPVMCATMFVIQLISFSLKNTQST